MQALFWEIWFYLVKAASQKQKNMVGCTDTMLKVTTGDDDDDAESDFDDEPRSKQRKGANGSPVTSKEAKKKNTEKGK